MEKKTKRANSDEKIVLIVRILEDYPGILQARAQYLCELYSIYLIIK